MAISTVDESIGPFILLSGAPNILLFERNVSKHVFLRYQMAYKLFCFAMDPKVACPWFTFLQ
jgi:hypothetical protein